MVILATLILARLLGLHLALTFGSDGIRGTCNGLGTWSVVKSWTSQVHGATFRVVSS